MAAKFFTRRFYLDTTLSRSKDRGGAHYVGPFRSFWVSKSSGDFDCRLVIDPKNDSETGLPLRLNQCQDLGNDKALEACIESETAQSGVWVEITFSQDYKIDVGSVTVSLTGKVSIDEGSLNPQSKVTVSAAVSLILDADGTRKVADFQYKAGAGTVYIGSQDELNDADFANICHHVLPGDDFGSVGPGAKYAKSVGGDVIFSLEKGMA